MTAAHAATSQKFLRKTTLRGTEANTNFKMLDDDIAEAITSAEADEVTPLMSKVYTRLLLTPAQMREGGRVLRFAGEERAGKWVTAWEQLRAHLRVSSETARKALRWMHEQGIIGYFAGKNGVGIRIFLNRAANSVSTKREARAEKILPFARASVSHLHTSPSEMPFNDSFAVSRVLDSDLNPGAPKNGAGNRHFADEVSAPVQSQPEISSDRLVQKLRSEIEPLLRQLARRAAADEHARTREWLERSGLPKAARVAQRETYDVLRRNGFARDTSRRTSGQVCSVDAHVRPEPRRLSESEVAEFAEACVALFEAKGQPFEMTVAGMEVAAGGTLLPEDAPRVLKKAETLFGACDADV
jgi:DNA-binding transcriptional regulator YhcF (GntR family)